MTDEQAAMHMTDEEVRMLHVLARSKAMGGGSIDARLVVMALDALSARYAAAEKVVRAALAWRTGRDRTIVGTAPPGGTRSHTGIMLIDAIDAWRAGEAK